MRFRGENRCWRQKRSVNNVIMAVRWWWFCVSASIASFSGFLSWCEMVPNVALTTTMEKGDGLVKDVGGQSMYGPEAPRILAWKPLSNVRQRQSSGWNHCLKLYKLAYEPVNSHTVQQLRDQTAAPEWRRASSGSGLRVLPPIVPAGFCITPEWPLSKQGWFMEQPPPSSRASEAVHVLKKRVNASVRPAGPLSRVTGRNFNELVGLFPDRNKRMELLWL